MSRKCETKHPYAPHGFLADAGVDFKDLDVPVGTQIFYTIADWVNDKGRPDLIPDFLIESAALLYHIVFGCGAKLKTLINGNEIKQWKKIQKIQTDMAYRSWRQIWQIVAENSAANCGASASDEICLLFPEYERALLVCEKPHKKQKSKFDFELSDLPDWNEEDGI